MNKMLETLVYAKNKLYLLGVERILQKKKFKKTSFYMKSYKGFKF